jgi:F-type H+-transporting ATPase subunit epsilon
MASLTLDILTPQGPVTLASDEEGAKRLSESMEIDGVEIPGLLGEMGVLPGHVPFITPVKPGVLRFKLGGDDVRMAVGGGFLEISEDGRVTILAERALLPEQIDTDAVTSRRDELKDALGSETRSIETPEIRNKRQELEWAESQLRAAQS